MNIHLQGRLISKLRSNKHMVTKLQHVVFTKTGLLAVEMQSEKYFLVLNGFSRNDIKAENPWFNSSPHSQNICAQNLKRNSVALVTKISTDFAIQCVPRL